VGGFSDSDAGDYHLKTEWRVFRADDGLCVLNVTTNTFLTEFSVPAIMLDEHSQYHWDARFFDSSGTASEWSGQGHFSTSASSVDADGNGIPDDQEVDDSVDMNQDGIPDAEQEIINSVLVPSTNLPIGLSIENADTVSAILFIEALDRGSNVFRKSIDSTERVFPQGLINFKLLVQEPGDTAIVTVYFSKPIPKNCRWMKYISAKGAWFEYGGFTQLSEDRMSMELELVDGGLGDDDGVANGIIVDPAGFQLAIVDASSVDDLADGIDAEDSESMAGICFITSTAGDESAGSPMAIIFLLFGIACVMCAAGRRVRVKRVS
jgi:hypothetical protein